MAFNLTDLEYQKAFNQVCLKLSTFFRDRGFIEVHCQSHLSLLGACENPLNLAQFEYNGQVWVLPQTNQNNLEQILLLHPSLKGIFCYTTSFREEINPIPGRHDKIFEMHEMEMPGHIEDLIQLERDLCKYLGFVETVPIIQYEDACQKYGVITIEAKQEELLQQDYGNAVFLKDFPLRSDPFWNMLPFEDKSSNLYKKVDLILHSVETIGGAERSCNPEQMRHNFYTITNGEYANTLFARFGKERVEKELEEYLSYDFFPRVGFGLGIPRLVRALKLEGIL